jgi:FRG domain
MSDQDSRRITPPTARLEAAGQQAGKAVWRSVRVNDPRPLEYIAERAKAAVFRGYWAPSKEERDRHETPDVKQALMTGLERLCLRADNSLAQAPRYEARIIREFRRRIHHYLPGVSLPENSLELIALMQHHGAPTRLLDWTYSPCVAAHFALIHASRRPAGADLAIWTIRHNWCRDASKAACKGIKPQPVALWKQFENPKDDQRAGSSLLSNTLPPSVWPVNPFRLNERLTIQQGLFLAPRRRNGKLHTEHRSAAVLC